MIADSTDLSPLDYLRPVWRFKWLVLVVVVAAAGATYYYYSHKPKVYQASTQIYVGASELDTVLQQVSSQGPRSLSDDAALITTPPVAARVVKDLKLNISPAALSGAVSVVPSSDSDFLTLTVTSGDPQQAASLVNGFARAYLEVSTANASAAVVTAEAQIQRELSHLSGPASQLRRESLDALLVEVQGAALLAPQAGSQPSQATAPTSPVSPNPKRDAIFAGALALLLGLIASYIFDRSDTRLRELHDFERILGSPVLATIPRARRTDPSDGDPIGTTPELREPYRTLRVNLDLIRVRDGLRVLMVTSALPEEGKTTVVRNLALAYHEAGLSVAIVDGDMRRPRLAALFGASADRGLSDILQSGAEVASVLVSLAGARGGPRLDLVGAGQPPENPTALLRPEAFRSVRHQLLADHDVVLVDSPPLLAVSDAVVMGSEVDGVLVVVRAGVSTEATVRRLRHTLRQMPDARLLGAVANAVVDDLGAAAYGYYATDGEDARSTAGTSQNGASGRQSPYDAPSFDDLAAPAGRAAPAHAPLRAEPRVPSDASSPAARTAPNNPPPPIGQPAPHDPTSPYDPIEPPASRMP